MCVTGTALPFRQMMSSYNGLTQQHGRTVKTLNSEEIVVRRLLFTLRHGR